jgi:hypothetical protein
MKTKAQDFKNNKHRKIKNEKGSSQKKRNLFLCIIYALLCFCFIFILPHIFHLCILINETQGTIVKLRKHVVDTIRRAASPHFAAHMPFRALARNIGMCNKLVVLFNRNFVPIE